MPFAPPTNQRGELAAVRPAPPAATGGRGPRRGAAEAAAPGPRLAMPRRRVRARGGGTSSVAMPRESSALAAAAGRRRD